MAKPSTHLAVITSKRNGGAGRASARSSLKGIHAKVTDGSKTLHLHGDLLVEALSHTTRRDLIDRFFALPALNFLHLNTRQGKARLHFEEEIAKADVLDALAAALRRRTVERLPLANDHLLLDDMHPDAFEIRRVGGELTFWRIEMRNPGHYRLWHPLLRSDFVRDQVLQEFATLPDVVRKAPSYLHRATIHIWVRPHRIDPGHLIEILDPVLANYMAGPAEIVQQPFKEAVINANLFLSPISDFIFPPAGLINAVMVGTINRSHIVPAFRDLRQGRTNLHLLYLSIGALTLFTFSFFAAAVMYWDVLHRQVRLEGVVTLTTAAESDAYFATRSWQSRIGAWASQQSAPIASRAALEQASVDVARRFGVPSPTASDDVAPDPGVTIPRPPHWGGYHLWVHTVELWVEGVARLHDRARWTRSLAPAGAGFSGGAWSATRLQP